MGAARRQRLAPACSSNFPMRTTSNSRGSASIPAIFPANRSACTRSSSPIQRRKTFPAAGAVRDRAPPRERTANARDARCPRRDHAPTCAPTNSKAFTSWPTSARTASAASSPTTWASAKRCKPSPGSPGCASAPTRNLKPKARNRRSPSSSARRACWTTGAPRSSDFCPACACACGRRRDLAESPHRTWSADLLVLNYAQLRSLEKTILARAVGSPSFSTKASRSRTPTRQTAKFARELDSAHRLVLTGTPIENRLLDLWSLMAFAMPGVLGTARRLRQAPTTKGRPRSRAAASPRASAPSCSAAPRSRSRRISRRAPRKTFSAKWKASSRRSTRPSSSAPSRCSCA